MQRKRVFSSEVTKDGRVRITVFRKNEKPASADIPPEAVPLLACTILRDAQEASGEPDLSQPLGGSPFLNPDGLGLTSPDPRFPTALVVHMGKARFGVAISNPRELWQALLAASASPDKAN